MTAPVGINIAAGAAQVGQQVGHIDTQIHYDVTHVHNQTYQIHGDTPQEQFRVAKEHLDGGAPTTAEGLIADAVARDRFFPEAAYYWALAILSGRPFDHLDAGDFGKLRGIFDRALACGADQWRAPLGVIEQFVEWWIAAETARDGVPHSEMFDQAMTDLAALPAGRRTELERHLAMVLHWGRQDRSDADIATEITRRRMGRGRPWRVPLFFEPDPAAPRRRQVAPVPFGPREDALLAGRLGLLAGGLFALFAAALTGGALEALLSLVVFAGGGLVAVRVGLPYQYALRRRRAKEREYAPITVLRPQGTDPAGTDPSAAGAADGSDFGLELDAIIAQRFGQALPPDPADPGAAARFRTETAPWRVRLRDELVASYQAPPVEATALDWLVRWHAGEVVRGWQDGALRAYRTQFDPRPADAARLFAALVVVAGGLVIAVATAFAGNPWLAAVFPLTAALGSPAVPAGLTRYTERRRSREEEGEATALERAERSAYEQERARLEDRPSDAQMAQWLEYDKEYVRTQAMRQYTLKSGDVIAHFILTEPAPGSQQARMLYGTTRYSRYLVKLFLLTANGVREIEQVLDFASGATNNEQRRVFRYTAIAAVNTTPRTVRPHGRRQVASPAGGGPANRPMTPVLRQAFRITLLNGPDIAIEANYDTLLPLELRERSKALADLVEETTGANSALLTLESVAAEGQDWIRREKERMRHKLAEFRRRD